MEKNFDFGYALDCLKQGFRVARKGWNGKGMYLFLVIGFDMEVMALTAVKDDVTRYERGQFIAMKTTDNKIVPWLASQTDVLAEDWELVNQ